ncbi:10592_t:CDS:2 [Ambispora gerdemannii]|uniref:10592_t:CDS:1 n=1 Tax=Ambispora gerdemannii TaxID=144530 RepID=A0A9N9H4S1_9GLOM|nr:10592_t:CDS:2 [Ambispora gerdemannii]
MDNASNYSGSEFITVEDEEEQRLEIESISSVHSNRSNETRRFQLYSKSFFLTYPRCDIETGVILEHLKGLFSMNLLDKYIICKEEHQDGEGHLHAYIVYSSVVNVNNIRAFDYEGYHPNIQSPKNKRAIIKYIMKQGDYISNLGSLEYTLDDVVDDINKGVRELIIATKYPVLYIRHSTGIKQLRNVLSKRIRINPTVVLRYGDSSTGKSTDCYNNVLPEQRYYELATEDKDVWFDTYDGEEVLILNDFYGSLKYSFFLKLCRGELAKLPVKSSFL